MRVDVGVNVCLSHFLISARVFVCLDMLSVRACLHEGTLCGALQSVCLMPWSSHVCVLASDNR